MPKQRNTGIDALRALSMFMVIILHIQGDGGLASELLPFSAKYEVAWLLEATAFCAVNCYALISGYVGIQGQFKLSRIIYLWFQVAFYSLLILVLFAVFRPSVIEKEQILSAFLPVSSKQYWYFSAYFALFFLTPFLNHLVLDLPKHNVKQLLVLLVLLFSVLPTFAGRDLFYTGEGYSPLWLAILYLIGAYIQRYEEDFRIKPGWLVLAYLLFVAVMWISKRTIEEVVYRKLGTVFYGNLFFKYSSPTALGAAVALLLFFSVSTFKKEALKKCIRSLSSVSFGVYLIHTNPLIFKNILSGAFVPFSKYPVVCMVVFVLMAAWLIYLVCWIIDTIRKLLFDILKVRQLSERLERVLKSWWVRVVHE